MLELRLIRHALALAQQRNFARAAEQLGITQPSLSRSIAALERSLGMPLFDRSHKGVTPTPYGRVLLEQGEAMLRREAHLRRELQLLAGLELGSLAVGAGPFLAETTVAEALASVAQAHPRLRIQCTSTDPPDLVRQVLEERLDVGVGAVKPGNEEARLRIEPLPVKRGYLACRPGHPLTRETTLNLKRVLEFPLVTTVLRGSQAALAASGGSATSAHAPDVPDFAPQITVNSAAVARRIARTSDAIVGGTGPSLTDDLASGALVLLDVYAPAMQTRAAVYYLRERTLAPSARLFIDTLKAIEAQPDVMPEAKAQPRRSTRTR